MNVQSESPRGPDPAPVPTVPSPKKADDKTRRRSPRKVSRAKPSGNGATPKPEEVQQTPEGQKDRLIEATGDLFFLSVEGMESHLQIKGSSPVIVLEATQAAIKSIVEAGGTTRAKSYNGGGGNGNGNGKPETKPAESNSPVYTDEKGVKRCNRQTVDGERCGEPVTQRDGKFGPFWSCHNYKNHAKTGGRG